MAEPNRGSGRQNPSSNSGRQVAASSGSSGRLAPATRTSGRGQIPLPPAQPLPPPMPLPVQPPMIQRPVAPRPSSQAVIIQPPAIQPPPQQRPSGRLPAQQPSGSGRLPVQQPSGSGRLSVQTPSGRLPVQTPSGRMPQAMAAPAAASNRSSRRGSVPVDAAQAPSLSVRKRARGVGKELLICFAVLGFMGVGAVVLGVIRSGQAKKVSVIKDERERIFNDNMKLGFDTYQKAETAGLLWVMGKDDKATDDKLFGLFKNDDKIYNIVYDRNYKDKKNASKMEQKAMVSDRLRIDKVERGKEDNGIRVSYGLADNRTRCIVIASKPIKAQEGDSANLGGMITIIANAEQDDFFLKAKTAKSAAEKAKEAEKKE
jgi:hypothetical protein